MRNNISTSPKISVQTNHLLIVLVLFGALLLASCTSAKASTPAVPEDAKAGDLIDRKACEYNRTSSKTTYPAECGTLVVPENWDVDGSRLIALPVVRIPAKNPNPAEPVFYLVGGPGMPNRPWALPDWLLEEHDVVAVGYRGVDGTVALECPIVKRLLKAHQGEDLYSEQARAAYASATRECAATHQAAGVDLSGYTVPGIVEDMESARKALGYDRINLYSLSFGTRAAQIYAYLYPDSLHRLVLIGVATPGSMVANPADLDELIEYIGELCAKDVACSSRTGDFAQTMYQVNHNMPERWLFFKIDPATIRLSIQMFMQESKYMPMAFDAYLAAAEGDPSGLAMLNRIAKLIPIEQLFGDQASKIGTLDMEKYGGIESISLRDSIMGSPMAEALWPAIKEWPVELVSKELREFQETNVEMLLVNGTVDVSTLPYWLDEASTFFHRAQIVLLPEFGHTGDVHLFQPEAFERLVTSYYDTGVADDSLFVYQPLSFEPGMRLPVIARLLVAALLILPALVILGVVMVVRRIRKHQMVSRLITLVVFAALLLAGCRSTARIGTLQTEVESVELGDARPVSVEIPMGAGNLEVTGGADKLLEDGFTYNVAGLKPEMKYTDGRNVPAAPSRALGPADPAEMEAFMDDLFAQDMKEYNINGAAVSVVKDGKLFFAKGYGYADFENKIPVDDEQTVFRIGSVGKLFTWTAVMQLAEQGKLDLDADVNTYLDFRIPDTYPGPITLKHLMTHTAGFEDLNFENFTWDADGLMPVGVWLASHIPARVRPPGEVAAYSNYGAELAGYIVARVSGKPYEQYIQEHIFDPLGMVHTTAQVPVPPDLRAHASLGYWDIDGVLQPVPDYPEYFGQAAMGPAGSHSSSTTDMARFMIAHLQDGRYSDVNLAEARILKESTMQQMHSTLYTPDPRILGTAYGFFDFSDNGQRTIGHSGGTLGFTTLLLLLPEQNLGVFVAYNNESSGRLTTQHYGFQRAFFDHYYPAPAAKPIQPAPDFAKRAGRFTGSYRSAQSGYSTFEKLGNLMSSVKISDLGDSELLFTINGLEMRLVEVGPLYFRQADGPFGIVFREDDRGRITHMYADLSPQYAFEKLNWYETAGFNMALVLGSILVFLSLIPAALIIAIRNRRPSSDRKPASRGARMANWTILGISVLNLLFVIATVLVFGSLGFPRFGVPWIYRIVLGLGVLSAVLTVGALVYTVLAWKNRYWGMAGRAYYTIVTVAAVAFVWFLNYWNLLGWRF